MLDVLGEEDFEAFTALTAVHGDGWGMAWQVAGEDTVRATSSATSAVRDPAYARLAREPLGRAGIVHLRWATPGIPVSPENTHPFCDDGYAFAHNGHIAPLDRLEGLLTEESRAALRGTTDSERYFRFVLQCIRERGDEAAGLSQALDVLVREFPDASLNALLLTPCRLFGVHVNRHASPPLEGLLELFPSRDQIPYRHTDDYFAMDYRLTGDAVHVISSGIDQEGWMPVPEDSAAMVDVATLEVTRLTDWGPASADRQGAPVREASPPVGE